MVNLPKHCRNLHHSTFIIFIDHCQVNWVWKCLSYCMPNLRTACYHMAADETYPVLNRDILTIPIQIQLSQKHKIFRHYFTGFLKSRKNFEHFDQKDDAHRFCNFEITHSENVVRKISKNLRLREPFNKQHAKWAEPVLKSASQDLYHIHWSLPSQLSWKTSLLLTW